MAAVRSMDHHFLFSRNLNKKVTRKKVEMINPSHSRIKT